MKTLLLLMTVLAFEAPDTVVARATAVFPSEAVPLATAVTSFN